MTKVEDMHLEQHPEYFRLKYEQSIPVQWIENRSASQGVAVWTVPTIANPISQMCTASQFFEPDMIRIAAEFGVSQQSHPMRSYLWGFSSTKVQNHLRSLGEVLPLHRWHWERFYTFRVFEKLFAIKPRVALSFPEADMLKAHMALNGGVLEDYSLSSKGSRKFDLIAVRFAGNIFSESDLLENVRSIGESIDKDGTVVLIFDVNFISDKCDYSNGYAILGRSAIEMVMNSLEEFGIRCDVNFHTGDNVLDYAFDNEPYGLPHIRAHIGNKIVGSFAVVGKKMSE